MAELARVGEVLQYGHEAENRTDDTEGGRVDAHALKYFGGRRISMLAHVEIDVHDAADVVRLGAVYHQLQGLLHEVILLPVDHRLESEQALLAGDVAPLDHLGNQQAAVAHRRTHHPGEYLQCALHDGQGRLDEDGRARSDHDEHERGGKHERHEARALEHGAHQYGDQCEHQP